MKKIKVFLGTVAMVSILGITSFAAITTTPKGVQKLDSADIVDVLNNNADVLDNHIGGIANADILGHVKIGAGLQVSEDGIASVKIANDLETDDTETALSAAMGKELYSEFQGLGDTQIKMQIFNTPSDSGFYYTNSFYIPSSTTVEISNVNVFGASGNFANDFKLSRYGNYLSFYTGNKNLAGKSCNFAIVVTESE
ncbi:hypothetical protein [Konateibacter massiliensis]|uniref:hypothetical protein n=1 Tax=Konateibacter massiliensis TaxID=2002841 RepID=UPI000C15A96E|nr:hypothetical protein [Konateibacter massiliensis]